MTIPMGRAAIWRRGPPGNAFARMVYGIALPLIPAGWMSEQGTISMNCLKSSLLILAGRNSSLLRLAMAWLKGLLM